MRPRLESDFQKKLKKKLELWLPGCVIKRNSTDDIQGFPDLTVFHHEKYALLEVKRSEFAPRRPNQEYYVDYFNSIGGYATFVYPENLNKVIKELIEYFEEDYTDE